MTIQQTYQFFQSRQKLKFIITACIVAFICANVLLDFSFTLFQNSSFYISESLLFSSYWLLFFPLLAFVLKISKTTKRTALKASLVISVAAFHLFIYPALVWIISNTFYPHTFDYWQTFNFGLSAYCMKTFIIYGFSAIAFTLLNKPYQSLQIDEKNNKTNFATCILVADSNNKKIPLQVNDIFCFSAKPPYVSISHSSKKYLHTETLKSLERQLDDKQFIRIHKSHIVNIHKIAFIRSRQNGDYDIGLLDNTILRLSRSYAKKFKSRFEQHTRLTAK